MKISRLIVKTENDNYFALLTFVTLLFLFLVPLNENLFRLNIPISYTIFTGSLVLFFFWVLLILNSLVNIKNNIKSVDSVAIIIWSIFILYKIILVLMSVSKEILYFVFGIKI